MTTPASLDVESLHRALQQSFSPDESLRRPAEELIKELKFINGSCLMLIRVATETKVQFEVRQAAAIQLKNITREAWAERQSIYPLFDSSTHGNGNEKKRPVPILPEDQKLQLRTGILDALLSEHEKSLRDLFAETFNNIAIYDYPQKWGNLLPTLLNAIGTPEDFDGSALRVHNALLALRKLCKRYEYKSREQRGPLNDIVQISFPLLLPWGQRLAGNENEISVEAAMMLKQILKIFWSSTQFYLPGFNQQNNPIAPWFDIIYAVLAKPLPEKDQPKTEDERNAWPWWKAKKWAIQILSRLFNRYGMPSYVEEETKAFAQVFANETAPRFMQPIFELLNLRPSGQFCTDRVLHLCLSFLNLAVELAPTYKVLKPHLDFLLFKVCFPTCCLTPEYVELFETDPHEFISRQNNPLTDFYDPKMSAISLITDLVKHRGKDVVPQLLSFLTNILSSYAPESGNHIEKEGALFVLGSMNEFLLAKKKYSNELEGMMVSSVFTDFPSSVPFLRYRACWMVQRFSKLPWSNPSNLQTLIHMVLQRLSDPALPVQIEASKALRFLIELDGAENTLAPVLPQILTEYFRIMNEIGNDEVVAALQVIIDKFGNTIEPHAVVLIQQLTSAFQTYCTTGDDDDDTALAAAQCLECIATVLKGVAERPEMYTTMEPHLIPIIMHILGNEGDFIEYLEYALDILTYLTFFPETISPPLWEAVPLIYRAFDEWAFDYLNMMVIPLENFIQKAPAQFLTATTQNGVKYIQLIFSMVEKTVGDDRSNESECRKALSLFMSILHECPGMVDSLLPAINDIMLAKLNQQVPSKSPLTRIQIFAVLGSCFYYNPQLQLQELEKRNITAQVFQQWIKDIELMDRWIPQKMSVLGISAIFKLPTSIMPSSLTSLLPMLLTAVVNLCNAMQEEAAAVNANEEDDIEGGVEEDEWEDEEDDGGFDENEDVRNEADAAYADALNKASTTGEISDVAQYLMGSDPWDEFDEDDDNFQSSWDNFNELIILADFVRSAFQNEPEAYQQLQGTLSQETLGLCQKLFADADKEKAEAESNR